MDSRGFRIEASTLKGTGSINDDSNMCGFLCGIILLRNVSQSMLLYSSLKSNKYDIQIMYVRPVERRLLHSNIARLQ